MITDGTFICSLCGQDLTGCYLCGKGGAPLMDVRTQQAEKRRLDMAAERELDNQSRSIRRGAETRNQ